MFDKFLLRRKPLLAFSGVYLFSFAATFHMTDTLLYRNVSFTRLFNLALYKSGKVVWKCVIHKPVPAPDVERLHTLRVHLKVSVQRQSTRYVNSNMEECVTFFQNHICSLLEKCTETNFLELLVYTY